MGNENVRPAEVTQTPADALAPLPITDALPPRPITDALRRRLATVEREPRSWLPTGGVVLIAAILRLVSLSKPPKVIFDETYYAVEAQELLHHGVEWRPETNTGDFVVHPPLGKWLIAIGELIFGNNSFGWRIAAMVAGTLSVLLTIRIARRMFRSTVLGCAAGLLLTFDGLHFVLSRTALLDIFLTMFVLGAFGCLVLDRDHRRRHWLAALAVGATPPNGAVSWWRAGAGALLGAACAVKQSGVFFLPALVLVLLIEEVGLRRSIDPLCSHRRPVLESRFARLSRLARLSQTTRSPRFARFTPHLTGAWRAALRSAVPATAVLVGVALAVYLASWTGWFASDAGWNRHGLAARGQEEPPILSALINLWDYHQQMFHFHSGLRTHHTYQSWPWQWLLMARPVAFYWETTHPCGADKCAAEVLLLGTPLLWWSFLPALAGLTWFGVSNRDRRTAAIGFMVAAALLPWMWYEYANDRTMFVFYALPAEPFMIFAIVYVFGSIMGRAPERPVRVLSRRTIGAVVLGLYLISIISCFWYFYPIYIGESIPYAQWWDRMWLGIRWV